MSSLDLRTLESIREYIGFDELEASKIRDFLPLARPYFRATVDDFYATIEEHEEARQVITGGKEQVERLKDSLKDWLESLLSGSYDEAYLERRSRIGRVHVRIGLPQHLMFTAMSRVRSRLSLATSNVFADPDVRGRVDQAIHKLLDMELCIMLDSYREDLIEKQRARERLATIGELAASVGHELRNPLGTMESSLFLIKRRLERLQISDPQLEKHQLKVSRQVEHCNDTISRLLDLAREHPPRFERILLAQLLEQLVEQVEPSDKLRITVSVAADLHVFADPTQLGLVLSNLIRNASEAAPDGVTMSIGATAARGGVSIRVADDGPGIPDEVRERLFDALFTTRSQGTGLGLALVARIIEAHRGEITLEPSSQGASFVIWLPDANSETSANLASSSSPGPRAAGS
jgi:signal transduction histidine kinase